MREQWKCNRGMPRWCAMLGLVAVTASVASPAFAQSLSIDVERLQKRLEDRRTEHLPETAPAKAPSAPPAPSEPADALRDLRVLVQGYRITGAKLVPEAVLQKALERFAGRELGFAELQQAADALTQVYRERGYVASRAFVPQQTLPAVGQPAEVELVVLEGRYGRVRLENASKVPDQIILDRLGLSLGEPVELSKIERNLLIIEDLPGARVVSSNFTPGDRVGETEYILAVEAEPRVTGNVTTDNHGLRVAGIYRIGAEVNWVNPTERADQISGNVMTSGKGLDTGRLTYSLPLGAQGWRGAASIARGAYRLGEELTELNAEGTAETVSLAASYPIVRERTLNVGIGLGLDVRRMRDHINGTLIGDRGSQAWGVTLAGDEIGRLLPNGATVWSLGASQGRLNIKNESARLIDAAGPNAHGGFSRINGALMHEHGVDLLRLGMSLQMSLRGQYAARNLDPSEKMPLGGPTGVRSSPQGEASGDRAVLASVELKKRFAWVNGWGLTHSIFYDAGHATVNAKPWDASENQRTLRGYGLGVMAEYGGRYFLNGSIAWPVGTASLDPAEGGSGPRLWLQLGVNY